MPSYIYIYLHIDEITYTGGFDERVSDAVEKRMAKIEQTCLLKAPYLIHYFFSSTLVGSKLENNLKTKQY